jgi:hypothetical protein
VLRRSFLRCVAALGTQGVLYEATGVLYGYSMRERHSGGTLGVFSLGVLWVLSGYFGGDLGVLWVL